MSGRLGDAVDRVRERVPQHVRAGRPGVGLDQIRPGGLELRGWRDAGELTGTAHAFRAGDVLFGRLRPGFRKVVRVDRDGICSPEAWVLRVRPGFDPDYVLHRLAAPDVIARACAHATGSRMPRVPWEAVAEHAVCWPTLEDQRARARPLAALDASRAADAEALGDAVAVARSAVAREAGAPVALGTVAGRVQHAAPRSPPADLPRVGVRDLDPGRLAVEGWGRAGDARSRHQIMERGDLLFARIRPALNKVALAPVDGVASPELLRLRALRPVDQGLLAVVLSDPAVARRADQAATGTRMPRVHWKRLCRVQVAWPAQPSPALLSLCRAVCDAVLALGDRRRASAALRDALSPRVLA